VPCVPDRNVSALRIKPTRGAILATQISIIYAAYEFNYWHSFSTERY